MAARDLGGPLAILLAAFFLLMSGGSASAASPPFDPGGVTCFENLESTAQCDGNSAPGAASDIRTNLCVGWNDDCTVRDAPVTDRSLGATVTFTPADWVLPVGDTIPIGAIAGRLGSEAWLGLLNGPCDAGVDVSFTLMNAGINVSDTISPGPGGQTDVMQPLAQDVNPANGVPDGADKYPSFLAEFFGGLQPRARLFGITKTFGGWVTLSILFFEPGTTLEAGGKALHVNPALGYPGVTVLQDPTAEIAPSAITDFCAPFYIATVTLGKTINNPCTPTPAPDGANCPVTVDEGPEQAALGYPSFPCDNRSTFDDDGDGKINDGCPIVNNIAESGAQCDNNISDDPPGAPEDAAVNDGCPAVGQSEGERIPGGCSSSDEGGCTYRANPGSNGAASFITLAVSQRDADGDGIENSLDVCALIANPGWNPRAMDPADDTDNDGLPNVCDPNPTTPSLTSPNGCKSGYVGGDEDQDCFANRADNCPTVTQLVDPALPANSYPNTPGYNPPFAPDSDGDGIGDACDPDENIANGDYAAVCLAFPLDVGGAPGPVIGKEGNQCFIAGDIDCDESVDAVDALRVLRSVAGLPVNAPCTAAGNVKCTDGLTAVDALLILRHVARLPVSLPPGCPEIGT